MPTPVDHPERFILANEVHARPYDDLPTPTRASLLAVLVDAADRERERAHLRSLCEHYGVMPPAEDVIHFTAAFPTFRLKWERHGEFSTFVASVPGLAGGPFEQTAISLLPPDWLAALPGRTIAAAHAQLMSADRTDVSALGDHFGGDVIVGGEVAEGAGIAVTDFRIHADGFARFVLLDRDFTPRQSGRMLQRLFELEAYRVLALLALPIARRESAQVQQVERALTELTDAIARNEGADEQLLQQLTGLAARVESLIASSQYRIGASRAYYDLVTSRIGELRERRVPGLQTIGEFMGRRLAPAMATIESLSRRLANLSERVARASSLLATRVSIARERQNQALLQSMEKRARLQLRLQQTVEGLSVAAITYYAVGLVGYAAKGVREAGANLNPDIAMAAAVPVCLVIVAYLLRRMRRKIARSEKAPELEA